MVFQKQSSISLTEVPHKQAVLHALLNFAADKKRVVEHRIDFVQRPCSADAFASMKGFPIF